LRDTDKGTGAGKVGASDEDRAALSNIRVRPEGQEDLLILLSDQEAKLKEYKKKLAELGVEVKTGGG